MKEKVEVILSVTIACQDFWTIDKSVDRIIITAILYLMFYCIGIWLEQIEKSHRAATHTAHDIKDLVK